MTPQLYDYWQRQTAASPLFPDIAWSRPEQRAHAGRIGIIGGNKLGFAGVAEAYSATLATGAGQARALLPDALQRAIPTTITDAVYAPSNPSGGLSQDALPDMLALGDWAQMVLLIGDAGRNSETAIVYEQFLHEHTGPVTISRDAVDLVLPSAMQLVERPNTLLIVSFAQLQKLFRGVYYPKIITFSMQLAQLVEALHKFTLTYPVTIATYHRDTLIVAEGGRVTTTPFDTPMHIWRGLTATRASVYWTWNPRQPLAAVTASLLTDD